MRNEKDMMDLTLKKAISDRRIRAVIMNGSRVNPHVKSDSFQDYDIVYFVNDLHSFTKDHTWVEEFGDLLIIQMPDEMQLYKEDKRKDQFAYLMQFKDGNRIDLTLQHTHSMPATLDSLSKVLLDKDHLIPLQPMPDDTDYRINKPTPKEFRACCNEFWWVSIYVAKGLWRDELPYAKEMMEGPVRDMLKRLLAWHIGYKYNFSVNIGNCGKYLNHYLEDNLWNLYLATHADGSNDNMWKSLFIMMDLFYDLSNELSCKFKVNIPDYRDVHNYVIEIKRTPS